MNHQKQSNTPGEIFAVQHNWQTEQALPRWFNISICISLSKTSDCWLRLFGDGTLEFEQVHQTSRSAEITSIKLASIRAEENS